jgi:hypothetical protein
MRSWAEIWPPSGVRITEGDLQLSVVGDDDVPGLVDLALSGVHDPQEMPFSTPWTDDDPAQLPANNVRYYSSVRAGWAQLLVSQYRQPSELVGNLMVPERSNSVVHWGVS